MIFGMTRLLAAFACAAFALPAQQTTRSNVADLLGFERAQNGHPAGWGAYPTEHVSSDDQVYHGGQRSVRVERQPGSAQNFSGVTLTLPVDFGGSRIQLSGFVRTEDVTSFAAIWMRLDGGSGPLAFDTMQNRSRDGRWIYFGSNRTGRFEIWKAPVAGGEQVQVTFGGGDCAFESVDGATVYYSKGGTGAARIWKTLASGGQETEVIPEQPGHNFQVFAAGIYFAAGNAVKFLSFATGKTEQVALFPRPFGGGLAVSPDGQWFLTNQARPSTADLMLVENFR